MSIEKHGWEPPLLVSRAEACRLLGISAATAIRLEKLRKLTPIKLYPSENAKTHYKRSQVLDLAEGGDDNA
jgi:hypothetical protein